MSLSSEYVTLDDPRVAKKITGHPERGIIAFHHEPRMPNVNVPCKCWFMIPGDFAEITVEDVPLIGIVYEAAEHHYDANIFVDDENFYGDKVHNAYIMSGYMPSSDGYGRVNWILIPRRRSTIRVEATSLYNRMLDFTGVQPQEFCLSGFILMDNIIFPPPTYGSWCFKKSRQQDFLFTNNTLRVCLREDRSVMKVMMVPPGGYLYLMDLFGQGSLDFMMISIDHELRLDVFDGGTMEAPWLKEGSRFFNKGFESPTWSRQISIPSWIRGKGSLGNLFSAKTEAGVHTICISKKIPFGNRLHIRLFNPDKEPHNIIDVYMEGTLRLM